MVNDGWGNEAGTGRYAIRTTYKLDGVTQSGYRPATQLPAAYSAAGVRYAIGQLAVTEENAERIAAAKEELEADPRIVEMRKRAARAKAESDDYERRTQRIEAAMVDGVE